MTYYMPPAKRTRRHHRLWLGGLVLVLLALAGWWLLQRDNKAVAPTTYEEIAETGSNPLKSSYKAVDLQPTIDKWVANQSATYSIVVYDPTAGKTIGSHLPKRVYFAASLYKLFVAYLALEDIQNGPMNPNEILTGGLTRKQCIDKMIRESHSPCGEAMMADIGPSTLLSRVKAMGIKNTTFAGIQTTAQDCALILRHILNRRDLNKTNTSGLLNSMRVQDQRFRNGLALGAPKAKWETKVGWNETFNYHDVGIMTLPDKRKFIVAVLSQGNGSSVPIRDFAATIYKALTR